MKQLAEDVYLLKGWPPNAINVYLVGDVLIDAATRQGEKRIMRQIADGTVTAHALTHAHPDHQGSSHAICERLGIPLWCGQGDVPAMETPGAIENAEGARLAQPPAGALLDRSPPSRRARAARGRRGGRLHGARDARALRAGTSAFWRESDRVLILGDVLDNMNVMTGIPGLHEPPGRSSRPTRRATASPPAGWPSCDRRWRASVTAPPLRDPDKLAEVRRRAADR